MGGRDQHWRELENNGIYAPVRVTGLIATEEPRLAFSVAIRVGASVGRPFSSRNFFVESNMSSGARPHLSCSRITRKILKGFDSEKLPLVDCNRQKAKQILLSVNCEDKNPRTIFTEGGGIPRWRRA